VRRVVTSEAQGRDCVAVERNERCSANGKAVSVSCASVCRQMSESNGRETCIQEAPHVVAHVRDEAPMATGTMLYVRVNAGERTTRGVQRRSS